MDHPPSHAWQVMFPPLQAHAHGWLDVGDGHRIHWEQCGRPDGPAALFVHGGPGAGCVADDRRWFDPAHWRIVLFDQRGAGRSLPSGRVFANTTSHLLRDIEALRRHLQVERWLLFGGSWGATLALAYAQRHPERVSALVLRGVFTATASERAWLEAGATDALTAQLHDPCPTTARAAALRWWRLEQARMDHEGEPAAAAPADEDLLAMARIGVHYARHRYFLAEGQLLDGAAALQAVPGVMVQGEADAVTPAAAGLALHRRWPRATWQPVAGAGHASHHPETARRLVDAVEAFRETV